jgi:hypothetical protein
MVGATDDMLISTPCQPCDALSSGNWGSYSAMQGGKAASALRSEMTDLKVTDNWLLIIEGAIAHERNRNSPLRIDRSAEVSERPLRHGF